MEEVKKKRGRPRKNPLPEEIQTLIEEVKEKSQVQETIVENVKPIENQIPTIEWDYSKDRDIDFFDTRYSYELTGYRPITKDKGLDFNPDWFTEARDTFLRTGHYCQFARNSKAYRDFWNEEYRRCKYGMTSNGYTITGDNYFFLNYYQLMDLSSAEKAGAGRVYIFPAFYAGQYEWFHYVEMARRLRLNACLMKSREVGFSEIDAAIIANSYNCIKNSINLIVAHLSDHLNKTLEKVWKALSFLNDFTDGGFFKLSQVINKSDQKRASHYKMVNGQKVEVGWMSQITGIVADKPMKIRGDRTDLLVYEEAGCHIAGTKVLMFNGSVKNVEDISVGDKLMGPDGTERNVIELHSGTDQMYKLIMDNKEEQIVNSKHIIYGKKYDYNKKTFTDFTIYAEDFYNMVEKSPRKRDGYKIIKATLDFPKQEVPIDPYIFGYWLGDGDASKARFTSNDNEIIERIEQYAEENGSRVSKIECDNSKGYYHISILKREGEYTNWFVDKLKQLGVFNNKHIPNCYKFNDSETRLKVLAGLVDSDGTYNPEKYTVEITQFEGHKPIIDDTLFICRSLGLKVTLSTRISKQRIFHNKVIKGGVLQYRLRILYGHSQIPTIIPRKQTVDRTDSGKESINKLAYSFKIEKVQYDNYYGFSLDKDQLFLLEDFTVCHNSWAGLQKAFIQADALVGPPEAQWGIRIIGGTAGDEGPALEGLRDMYYNPETYGILKFRHNYTQTGEETLSSFFIPCTKIMKDRKKYLEHRGYVDEEKAKEFYDKVRATKASNPKALIIYSSEYPYTAEEAFSLEGDNKFNKINIADQLAQIRVLKKTPHIDVGHLEYTFKDGKHVESNINGFKWIPNQQGKIKILEHPIWTLPDVRDEESGKVIKAYPKEKIKGLYVIGIDGIDIGASQTSEHTKDPSDFCLVVKKRVFGIEEPQYVAIYKDRPNDIREAYKIAIRLAQYYNAIINIEATRQSIIPWARERKLLSLFMRRPKATLTDSLRNTNKQYGTPATSAIIAHQTDLIADFINDYCHTIWFEEMLDEFNRYTDENKRKFDIVASVAMAELADEELAGVVPKQVEVFSEDDNYEIGFYTDNSGCTRWGVIPKQNNSTINFNNDFGQNVDTGHRTSNSRFYQDVF